MMKVKPVKLGKTERMSFSHIDEVINGADIVEDLLQAFIQKPLIRVLLHLDQVRHTDVFVDVGEAHALGFAELNGLDFHHKINHSLLLYSTG